MGKWEDEIMGKRVNEMMRKRDNERMRKQEKGRIRSDCIRKRNGDLECKSFFKSLKTDM
jgi:hypothetical protein